MDWVHSVAVLSWSIISAIMILKGTEECDLMAVRVKEPQVLR